MNNKTFNLLQNIHNKLVARFQNPKLDIYLDTINGKTACFIKVFVTIHKERATSCAEKMVLEFSLSKSETFDTGFISVQKDDEWTENLLFKEICNRIEKRVKKE